MKSHRQNLDRSLALWLMALIVTLAGLCLPSAAEAHAGHGPGHHAHGMAPSAARAPGPEVATVGPTILVRSAIVRSAVSRLEAHVACGESCCTGGCEGACCSAIGLAPAEGAAVPAPDLTGPVPEGASSARTDVAPGCLPEPPRPVA